MRKNFFLSSLILFFFMFTGCENDIKIPKDYVTISDNEAYRVELQYPETVSLGEIFEIEVRSTNISEKILYKEVCSSTYKIGAQISVYITIEDNDYYLHDEFETLTDDTRIEKIKKNEILCHVWKFDGTLNVARHGMDSENGIYKRRPAPKGQYNIRISTGKVIEYAFEII